MAKNTMIVMGMSAIILIETFFIATSNGVPIMVVAFPIHQEMQSLPSLLPITNENVKRVHRRALESQPAAVTKQQEQFEPDDDLQTAAGTNVLRPLFVYRQQMAYRDRNNKRLAARRRAIPDYY